MSQSPYEVGEENPQQLRAFQGANRRLNALSLQGASWSGRERHCAFLNTGRRRFANVSNVSGFDFLNDGRGLALTDWDHDGDLDVWTTNRNGPRVRFCRNDAPPGGHFLVVRLEGRTCNRDAIGARVELIATHQKSRIENQKYIRTLRAGEGFVSQSSKWLHFGLGGADRVERLVVRWPNGLVETIAGVEVDRFVRIVQGTGRAEIVIPPQRTVSLKPSVPIVPEVSDRTRIVLASPCPAPPLSYTDPSGHRRHVDEADGPVLVNLWASWCLPCAAELRSFRDDEKILRDAGLDVVALSVDGLGDGRGGSDAAAQMMKKLAFPFAYGFAEAATIERLQLLNDHLVTWHKPLPVPTSFLLDGRGRLVAIYKGPVHVDELVGDLKLLDADVDARLAAAFPLPGRWVQGPSPNALMPLVRELIEKGHLEALASWALRDKQRLSLDPDYKRLLLTVGNELSKGGDHAGAETMFRAALHQDPQYAVAHRNLGSTLLRLGRATEALASFRQAVSREPEIAVHQLNLGATLARMGRFEEAAIVLHTAVALDPEDPEVHRNLGVVLEKQGEVAEAVAAYESYLALKEDLIVRRTLGLLLARLGRLEEALAHLGAVGGQKPNDPAILCELGRVHVALGRVDEGLEIYARARAVAPNHADAHHLAGDASLRRGDVGGAITAYRRTLQLQPQRVSVANNLAWILATSTDATLRDGAEAVRWAEHAAKLRGRKHIDVLDALGAAYAEVGRFEDAVRSARKAVTLLQAEGASKRLSDVEQRLQRYEAGQAYHGG